MEANAAQATSAERRASDRRQGSERRKGDRRTGSEHSRTGGSAVAILQAGFILAMQFIMIVIFCS